MMSVDCIIWLEDEEGENEVKWSSRRKRGEKGEGKNSLYKTVEHIRKPVTQNSWEDNFKTDTVLLYKTLL